MSQKPLALIVSSHEWLARSYESVLGPNGIAVVQAHTGRRALERTRTVRVDAIFIDVNLSDTLGIDFCRALRDQPHLAPGTPVFLITAGPVSRQERLDALKAGVWEIFGLPLDAEEFVLKVRTYMTAKIAADRARDESLLDQLTGFYNAKGLLRRMRELSSDASRYNRALACIAFAPEEEGEAAEEGGGADTGEAPAIENGTSPVSRIARLLRETCRASDAIGRVGQREFVIIAPNTDPSGAFLLAKRLTEAAEARAAEEDQGRASQVRLRAGLFAVQGFQEASIQPVEMLVRATMALRRSQRERGSERISVFSAPVADSGSVN